ncbi:uncharacterized protein LOC134243523 [Saccostrea cucullata]|uniref:uncharacterized protein LOC134243523 n=1 Tax=Saccostrea cuccullata TaxID=36930 RepID=UPI002ED4CDFF
MDYCIIIALLSNGIGLFANTTGVCSNDSEPLICCENYRKVGEACKECWPGTHAVNCIPCPPNFYGKLCRESCNNCTPCYPSTGCAPNESHDENITYNAADTSTRTHVHFFNQGNVWLALSVTIACSVGFTVFMLIYCKLRKRTSKRCQDSQDSEKPSPEIQMSNPTSCLTRENKPGLRLQNKYDSNINNGQFEDFGPYDTLNLKIRLWKSLEC